MKAVVQRVKYAEVKVGNETVGECREGFLVLLGVAEGDTEAEADLLVRKIVGLRVFSDEYGKMNRSITDIGGEMLVVSQFTLLANCRHGNRPDFLASAKPDEAKRLYEYFTEQMKKSVPHVANGIFGAHMEVTLLNNGPITILLDTDELKKPKNDR